MVVEMEFDEIGRWSCFFLCVHVFFLSWYIYITVTWGSKIWQNLEISLSLTGWFSCQSVKRTLEIWLWVVFEGVLNSFWNGRDHRNGSTFSFLALLAGRLPYIRRLCFCCMDPKDGTATRFIHGSCVVNHAWPRPDLEWRTFCGGKGEGITRIVSLNFVLSECCFYLLFCHKSARHSKFFWKKRGLKWFEFDVYQDPYATASGEVAVRTPAATAPVGFLSGGVAEDLRTRTTTTTTTTTTNGWGFEFSPLLVEMIQFD